MIRLALLAAVGCGATAKPQPATVVTEVRMLDRGAEPRRTLRYELTTGTEARTEITAKYVLATTMTVTTLDTIKQYMAAPTATLTVHRRVNAIDPDGSALIEEVIEQVRIGDDHELDRAALRRTQQEMMKLAGKRMTYRLSPRGRASIVATASDGDEWTDQVRVALETSMFELPEHPIGAGAIWEVTSSRTIGKVRWNQTTTYTVTQIADSQFIVKVATIRRAPRQTLSVEPTKTATLESGIATGVGTTVSSLREFTQSSSNEFSQEAKALVVDGPRRLAVTLAATFTSTMRPAP